MRPLRLVIAGLNSFKEEQQIDFRELCTGNVFGIFGPTGSGKSTVVDAITLALYGSVKRASRRTQGIINKGLAEASVLFEWQLGRDEQQRTYRVERKYVTKDDGVSCRLARLSELTDGQTIVLADKPSQVDQAVQAVLGLTEDDFTRAVVLPQGRFAEFLNLQGSERRRMLERIFGLAEYGEQLSRLVTERSKQTEQALAGVQQAQQVLGAAGQAEVAQAELQEQQAAAALAEAKRQADSARSEHDCWAKVRELQQEQQRAQAALAEALGEERGIASLRARVERQATAQRIASQLQAADLAQARATAAAATREQLSQALAQATDAEQVSETAARLAQQAKDDQEEPLVQRLQQLQRALELEQQLGSLLADLAARRQAGQVLRSELEQRTQASAALQQASAELTELLGQLQTELEQQRLTPEHREQLSAALAGEQRWQSALTQLRELEIELADRQRRVELVRAEIAAAESELAASQQVAAAGEQSLQQLQQVAPPVVDAQQLEQAGTDLSEAEQLAALGQRLEQQRQALAAQVTALEDLAQQLLVSEAAVVEARAGWQRCQSAQSETAERLRMIELQNLAATLAHDLQPGQACPVCGAAEHPHPAAASEQTELAEARSRLATAQAELQAAQSLLATEEAQLAARQSQWQQRQAQSAAQETELQELEAKWQQRLRCLSPALTGDGGAWMELPERARQRFGAINRLVSLRSQWQTQLDQQQRQLQADLERMRHCQQQAELARQTLASGEAEQSRLVSKRQELLAVVGQLQHELQGCLEQLGEHDLGRARARQQAMDRRAGELERSLQQRRQQRDRLTAEQAEAERQVTDLRERRAQALTEFRLQQANCEQLQVELQRLTAGQPAADLHRATSQQLLALRQRATAAQTDWEQARRQAAAAREAHGRAAEADRLAASAVQETGAELRQALERERFVTRGEAEEALAWAELVPGWQQRIREHDQRRHAWERRLVELGDQLQGQSIDESAWMALLQRLAAAAAAHEQAIADLAQSRELLQQVRARHQQWLELESQRVRLAADGARLAELVSLLRGNALVEFMAGEHLEAIAGVATDWLGLLTGRRYALEIAPDGGFLIRDDGNGSERRPVYTLSGGETFITSLALALALSSQVQLRGKHQLEFFFLDEGFGTLDPALLEVVMGCLERMQGQQMSIGIISHVPELRERIMRQVLVTPAEPGGRGSRVRVVVG